MIFSPSKYLLGLLVLCSASMIFAQDGISLVGPILSESDADTQKADAADQQVETDFRLEVSEFAMVPKNNQSETLTLVKIYDMKQPLGNSYILHVKGRGKATLIDPGYNGPAITRYLENEKLTPDAILLTNGTFYRIASNAQLKEQWPKIAIGVGEKDNKMLTDPKENQSDSFGGVTSPEPTIKFKGGERIETSSSLSWQVLDTPGYTPGSLSYQLDTKEKRLVFTGDFIYRDGIGGSQLPMGDAEAFDLSLQAFLEYAPAETLIYPGFGPNTTVEEFYKNVAVENANKDGIDVVAEGQAKTLAMPLTNTTSSVVYQNEIVEVYPTTTYVYSDFAIPRYYYPYYPYYRNDVLTFGLHVWSWLPVRRPPPPPHHHHLHGGPSYYWHGPNFSGRPNSNRPPHRPGSEFGGPPNRPNRPPHQEIGERPGRPNRPIPGLGGPSNRPVRPPQQEIGERPGRPSRPIPGLGGPSNRPVRPPQQEIGERPGRPSRPTPGLGNESGRPNRPIPGLNTRPGSTNSPIPMPGLDGSISRPQRPLPGLDGGSNRPTRPNPGISSRPGGSSRPNPGISSRPEGSSRPNPGINSRPGGSSRPNPGISSRPGGSSRPNPGISSRPGGSPRPAVSSGEARPGRSGGGPREGNRPSRNAGERGARD